MFFTYICAMITRSILKEARQSLRQFRALCITGPRQSGKTTVAQSLFKGRPYVSFEDPKNEKMFYRNPSRFLAGFPKGAILDEVQRIPDLFRYLQLHLDKNTARGQFILTGSNNFLLQQQISQSLAGRVGYLTLLPLSYDELLSDRRSVDDVNKNILTGGYPEIWGRQLSRNRWMQSYVQTYIQRDVRQLRNITNMPLFNRLVGLCANYAGQLINKDQLAREVGVDGKTIQSWLGVLESSYIVFMLQPWYRNLNKRIVKSPKLYFYDTGLLCTLLQIQAKEVLEKHLMYGAIYENWCIAELLKNRFNKGENSPLYFYRDHLGNEIDVIIEKPTGPLAVEMKVSRKKDPSHLSGLKYWRKYQPEASGVLLYQGADATTEDPAINYMNWSNLSEL